jgi:hypothetical protein
MGETALCSYHQRYPLPTAMTEEAHLLPEIRQVRVRIEGIVSRYIGADMNLALVDTLIASDAGAKLNGSLAAHGYNRLLHTIYLDVIKDLWAITLDRDPRSASLFQLRKLVREVKTKRALRAEYSRPVPVVNAGGDADPEEVRRIVDEHHRQEYSAQFDDHFPKVLAGIDDILTNGRLQTLERVRHEVVAHSSVANMPESGLEIVKIDRFQIHWNAAEAVFEELDPVVTNAALIFTGKNYGSSVRYKGQHREWATSFWRRMRELGLPSPEVQ